MNFQKLRNSLLLKYFLLFICALAPLFISSSLSIYTKYITEQKNIWEKLNITADSKKALYQKWIETLKQNQELILEANTEHALLIQRLLKAKSSSLNSQITFQKLMLATLKFLPTIKIFFLMSLNGEIIASTNPNEIGNYRGNQNYFNKDLLQTTLFLQTISYSSKVEGLNSVIAVKPVRDKNGLLLGFFCSTASSDFLDLLILDNTLYKSTEETLLIADNHTMLNQSKYAKVFAGSIYVRNAFIDQTMKYQKNFSSEYVDYRNIKVFGVSRFLPELKIVLIQKQDVKEVFRPLIKSIYTSIIIMLLALFWVVLLAYTFSRRILAPINHLSSTAKRIAGGELNLSINIKTEDELGSLGKSFNFMTASLNKKILELEDNIVSINSLKDAAIKNAELKSKFLNIAAHELRTPVTAFSLLLQVTDSQFDKGIPVDSFIIKRLRKQAERISSLVVDLLDVTRLERGSVSLKLEKKDLLLIIKDCVDDLKIREPKRKIIILPNNDSYLLNVDSLRISQVLSNLLENARKFSEIHDPITIKLQKYRDLIRVSISDQGIGITDEIKKNLFTPFSRGSTELTSRSGGLGLGLYLSSQIMKLHGGTIGVESVVGHGSTFYFELPINNATA